MTPPDTAMQAHVAQAHGIALDPQDAARMAAQAAAAAALLHRLSDSARARAGAGVFFDLALTAHAARMQAALADPDPEAGDA